MAISNIIIKKPRTLSINKDFIKKMITAFSLYFFIRKIIKKTMSSFSSKFGAYYDYAYLKAHGIETEFGFVKLVGLPHIHKTPGSTIKIGKGCVLVSDTKGNYAGVNHPVVLATTTKEAKIIIGDNFGASGSSIVAQSSVVIGNNTGLGVNSHIYDTDFHPIGWRYNSIIKSAPVTIGDYVWIAANCLILKGVNLANDTIIGAGSIVTNSTNEGSIVMGKKAELIKFLKKPEAI